jgi:hypothetical protein
LAFKLEVAGREQAIEQFAQLAAPLKQVFEVLKRVLEQELTAEESSAGTRPGPPPACDSAKSARACSAA